MLEVVLDKYELRCDCNVLKAFHQRRYELPSQYCNIQVVELCSCSDLPPDPLCTVTSWVLLLDVSLALNYQVVLVLFHHRILFKLSKCSSVC